MNPAGRLFQSFIVIRNGRDALTFDIDVDRPAVGSRYPSPLGGALCVFSEEPRSDGGLEEVVARIIGGLDVPGRYLAVAQWLDSRPAGWWVLSHDIDNDVLTYRVIGPFDRAVSGYLQDLLDYQTVQTESRRLTFLGEDGSRIVDYVWDCETFAVFLHSR